MTNTNTELDAKQADALRHIVSAVVETIRESGPLGAPSGVLYAALMAQGCTLNQFESLMGALVRARAVRKQGECYFAVRGTK